MRGSRQEKGGGEGQAVVCAHEGSRDNMMMIAREDGDGETTEEDRARAGLLKIYGDSDARM
jgi:hypothetical protein